MWLSCRRAAPALTVVAALLVACHAIFPFDQNRSASDGQADRAALDGRGVADADGPRPDRSPFADAARDAARDAHADRKVLGGEPGNDGPVGKDACSKPLCGGKCCVVGDCCDNECCDLTYNSCATNKCTPLACSEMVFYLPYTGSSTKDAVTNDPALTGPTPTYYNDGKPVPSLARNNDYGFVYAGSGTGNKNRFPAKVTVLIWVKAPSWSSTAFQVWPLYRAVFPGGLVEFQYESTSTQNRIVVEASDATTLSTVTTTCVATALLSSVPTAADWHLLGFSYDGTNVRVYFDGNLVGPHPSCSGNASLTPATVYVGGDTSSSFTGRIDEVMVFPRALSGAEVANYASHSCQ